MSNRDEAPCAGLWIEPIASEEELLPRVSEADRRRVAAFASPNRRRESLAWRALLYRQLGEIEVTYDDSGAPRFPHGRGFIGVSHTRNRVALCYSPVARCAVDMESSDRNFERVADRYLTPGEQDLSSHPAWLCIAWCAKECLYKLADRRALDLLRDLHLSEVCFNQAGDGGELRGQLLKEEQILRFCALPDGWVVWHLPNTESNFRPTIITDNNKI